MPERNRFFLWEVFPKVGRFFLLPVPPIRATCTTFFDVKNDVFARITEPSNDDYDNDVSDNCNDRFLHPAFYMARLLRWEESHMTQKRGEEWSEQHSTISVATFPVNNPHTARRPSRVPKRLQGHEILPIKEDAQLQDSGGLISAVGKSDLNSTEAYFATKNEHQKMAQLPKIAQK